MSEAEVKAEVMDLAEEVQKLMVTTESTKVEVEQLPESTEKTLKIFPCGNCGIECSQTCGNCKKEGYCSVACQKTQRSTHKQDCFPVKEEIGDGFWTLGNEPRSFWFATRVIKEGETIFTDYPLMVGPGVGVEDLRSPDVPHMCIGCHEILKDFSVDSDLRKCSQCRWPLCGLECSETQRHSKECEALCRMRCMNVSFESLAHEDGVDIYSTMRYIRLLALIKSNPNKWERFMSLDVPTRTVNKTARVLSAFTNQSDFAEVYKIACGLDELTCDTMCRLMLAEYHHQRPTHKYKERNKAELVVHDKAARLDGSCSCVNNCYAKPIPTSENKDKEPHGIVIIAAKAIQKGQRLTTSFGGGHTWDGTKRRRQTQMIENRMDPGETADHGFICKCERCVDPTEFGTYVSAVKCTPCATGYLLPLNPLDDNSDWKCDSQECSFVIPGSVVDEIVDRIQKEATELGTIRPVVVSGSLEDQDQNLFAQHFALLRTVARFLNKCRKELHPHHYILLNVQDLIIAMSTVFLHRGMSPDKEPPEPRNMQRSNINQLRTWTEIYQELANKLFPPSSIRHYGGHIFVAASNFYSAQQAVMDGAEFDTVLNFFKKGISNKQLTETFKHETSGPLQNDEYTDNGQKRFWNTLLKEAYEKTVELCSSNPKYYGIPDKIIEFGQNLRTAKDTWSCSGTR